MVRHLGGMQGGGKSYYACYLIFNNFSDHKKAKKDLKKDYHVCYTNLNEFKFDKVQNVYKFRYEPFLEKIELLHSMYLNEATDTELIEKSKELQLDRALFVIDEAQDYLEDYNKVIRWWLTYHRHLYHDILLLGVDVSQINPKYIKCVNLFLKAKPPFLKFTQKTFTYSKYIKYPFNLKDSKEPGTVSVPKMPEVFELYHSGDKVEAPNVVMKFLIGGIALFILLFFGFMWFVDSKTPDKETDASDETLKPITRTTSSNHVKHVKKVDHSNLKYFKIVCQNNDICLIKNKNIPLAVIKVVSENIDYEVALLENKNNMYIYHVLADSQLLNILNINEERKHENTDLSSVIPKF